MIRTLFLFFISAQCFAQKSMRVNVTSSGVLQDEVLIQFGVNFSNANKFNNINENLAILRDGRYWSVERRPELFKTDTTFLSFYGKRSTGYRFTFSPSGLPGNVVFVCEGKEYGISARDTVSLDLILTGDTSRMMILYILPSAKPLTYPNPVQTDTFVLTGLAAGKYTFTIFDQNGKYVYARAQEVVNGKIALSPNLKAGVYYINAQGKGVPQSIISIVKE